MIDLTNIFSVESNNEIKVNVKQPVMKYGNFNKPTNKLILAVDFDGTIVEDVFPKIGTPKQGAIESLKYLQFFGVQIILWTCRDGEYLKQAVNYLASNGILLTKINDNSDSINFKPSKKIYADYYLDDRSFPGFPGWNVFIKNFKTVYGIKE